jgi:transcription antitermination factor NusG
MSNPATRATMSSCRSAPDEVPRPDAGDPLVVHPGDRAWVVAHTRPRCEKKVEEYCRRNHWPVYLPLRRKVHRYGARVRAFLSPLFTGYVFCAVGRPGGSTLRQNRHVANVLAVVDQAELVEQLRQIRHALAAGEIVEVLPYLEKGRAVRVTAGPFKGLEGVVARVRGRARVVINVDMIQQAVSVEVDSSFLSPA